MRVGILLGDMDPTAGGGYTFQSDVLDALLVVGGQSRHFFVLLCHPDTAAKLPDKLLSNAEVVTLDVEPVTPRGLFAKRQPVSKPRPLDEQLRAAGVDFVWQFGAPGQVLEVPYMVVVWDLQHRLQPWFPEVSANGNWQHRENIYGSVLGRAAAIIVGTQAGKAEVERFFRVDPSRILIMPHPTPRFAGVAVAKKSSVRERYGLSGDYLFYPAQFWAHKNHVNLLLALQLLRSRFDNPLHAAFVGADHGNLGHVRSMTDRLDLSDHVHFLGFVPRDDLVELYREAFALSYVTFFGPENLPPLEAFALGCPVIASDVSGAREQLGDAVLFVDPSSPEQIAEAMIRLASEGGLRRQLIDAGRKIASGRTSEGFVAEALAFLDRFEAVRRCWA
jgi:glycosyltransferase involved in cell wall biosynthesis